MIEKSAVLIAVGDELILGLQKEANAYWLSRELVLHGYDVVALEVIGDDEEVLVDLLNRWAGKVALIVISGGLGPTHDDRTRESLAKFLNLPLVRDDEAYDQIIARYPLESRENLERSREKQASMPKGARPIHNPLGSALGFAITVKETEIFALPGVPEEFKAMAKHLLDSLEKEALLHFALCKVIGWPEVQLKDRIADIVQRYPANIIFLPEPNVVTVAIRGPERLVSSLKIEIRGILENDVLPEGVDNLEEAIINLASKLDINIAFAESCTGGMVGESITKVPGASSVFVGSAVCYSNQAKETVLGVPKEVIEKIGAVSEECALAMARGAANLFETDCSASITGIAGPSGGSLHKPVGTVCFAVTCLQNHRTWTRHLQGDREMIRLWSNNIALEAVWRELKKLDGKRRSEGSN